MKIYFLIIGLICLVTISSQAQVADKVLLQKSKRHNAAYDYQRVVKFGIAKDSSKLAILNPLSFVFAVPLYIYQKAISQQIFAACLYNPSCSEYSRLLFRRYGFLGGIVTTADRLMRCDRISATSIHPINVDETDGKIHESVERYSLHNKAH